jgi:DNA invertase Pin-like site-specific DNA recombinase
LVIRKIKLSLQNHFKKEWFFYLYKRKKIYKMNQYEATQKVLKLLLNNSKEDISKELGISRPTLDNRLKWHKWKKLELTHIQKL